MAEAVTMPHTFAIFRL